jgi:hypothetical protein
MRRILLWAMLIVAAPIVGASWFASPAGAQQTPSGKAGTEEPSTKAPSSPDHVFVNGALAVPGAPADSDTVPAKFSERNAADDRLITVAHTFKELSADQRRAIYQALKDQPATGSPVKAEVGVVLPPSVDVRAVPDQVAASVPQVKDYQFAVADNRVLLVSPPTRIVVGVFDDSR